MTEERRELERVSDSNNLNYGGLLQAAIRAMLAENAHLLATIILYESCGFIADPVEQCIRHNGIIHKPQVDRGEPHVEDVTAADLVPFQVQPMEY